MSLRMTSVVISSFVLLASAAPAALLAQTGANQRLAPMMQPVINTVPAPRDVEWPGGTMKLDIDATDLDQRIVRVRQTIPVASGGPLTLLLPEWLPGKHASTSVMEKIAGVIFTVDGKRLPWVRDAVTVNAFHLSLPENARTLVAEFQFMAPTASNQGRIVITDKMMNLQFASLSLYPAGYYVRRIPVQASVKLPDGWQAATALRGDRSGDTVNYGAVDYQTLIDSPIFAGKYFARHDLGDSVTLNVMADTPAELAATPEQIAAHKKLVAEALALYGAKHFDHYDFLFAISDEMGGIGLEHHRSSENGVGLGYFTKWDDGPGSRNLLPHEFSHSWDGKFRRPETLWTPDYNTPMQDELLWVYEGQDQFWGYVLGARSGIYSKDQTLDALAAIAARLDLTKGRTWRPVADTTNDPIISARRPKAWLSWQRNEDYYNEGLMIWLEANAIIARESNGEKGLDDFAKSFFGMEDGNWGELTYNRQDVIDVLNSVQPYDWARFLAKRVDEPTQEVTKAGFTLAATNLFMTTSPTRRSPLEKKRVNGLNRALAPA